MVEDLRLAILDWWTFRIMMISQSQTASKADVFSLAKTLWMFLSGDEKSFDEVYDYLDQSHSLRYVSRFRKEHLVIME